MSPQPAANSPWHSLPGDEVLRELEVDPRTGLTAAEADRRRARFGLNVIATRKGRSAWIRFLLQFHSPLLVILIGAGAISLLLGEWVDGAVILGVVVVNAVVGFLQENKALRAIDSLAKTMTVEATVRREGQHRRVPTADLVLGDVVRIEGGDRVPADVRLLECKDLHTDESMLTGESVPVGKSEQPVGREAALAERRSMGYAGSLVTRGRAEAVVVSIGDATELGRISGMIASAEDVATPLTRKLAAFGRRLLWIILLVAAATFVVGLLRGKPPTQMFMAAVALAVGAIPEGLPASMTIMLAIGVARMASRHAIVRKLPAVETLGSTTVICTDKTGTLTENQMTVSTVRTGGHTFSFTGTGFDPEGEVLRDGGSVDLADEPPLRAALTCAALCNDAELLAEDGGWTITGDPTEGALVVAARKAGIGKDELDEQMPRVDAIPFESERQFMATLHSLRGGAGLVAVKGAVERVVGLCRDRLDGDGGRSALEPAGVLAEAAELSATGLRVLALAQVEVPAGTRELTHDALAGRLTYLGLAGMHDPPRPEVAAAIAVCRSAGIGVKMITGDHALTAAAIARAIGLLGEDRPGAVITGSDLAATSDAELPARTAAAVVFARMTSEEKLRLVKALQSSGQVVAMTGDGVNDAPALRQADIGVAMGATGTEAAKEAADIVLADDNFASIAAAVEEGRTVFANLTKLIVWTLPADVGESLIIVFGVAIGDELPILPVQALYINLVTSILLGTPLVFERPEPGTMSRPPRDPALPIITFELLMRTGLVGLLTSLAGVASFHWERSHGVGEAEARTAAVTVVVVVQIFYLFNVRALTGPCWTVPLFSNRWLWLGIAAMLLVHAAFAYLPAAQDIFRSAPLESGAWIRIACVGVLVLIAVELEKALRRAFGKGPTGQTA